MQILVHERFFTALYSVPSSRVGAPLELVGNDPIYNYSYIVFEWQENVSLLQLLQKANNKHVRLSPGLVKCLFKQIVESVFLLQEVNLMAHLDLKPDIVMLSGDYNPAIIDFGLSSRATTRLTTGTGTPQYETPESKIVHALPYGYDPKPVDIFNLGQILFLLSTGQVPFLKAKLKDKCYSDIANHRYATYLDRHPATNSLDPSTIDMDMIGLIFRCLSYRQDKRPTITELREHIWVTTGEPEVT